MIILARKTFRMADTGLTFVHYSAHISRRASVCNQTHKNKTKNKKWKRKFGSYVSPPDGLTRFETRMCAMIPTAFQFLRLTRRKSQNLAWMIVDSFVIYSKLEWKTNSDDFHKELSLILRERRMSRFDITRNFKVVVCTVSVGVSIMLVNI